MNQSKIQNIEMDKDSTEIISNAYSEILYRKVSAINDQIENISKVAENDNSDVESNSVGVEVSKKNITNATTAQLSAQVMNLPYSDFNGTISSEAIKIPERITYSEIDILKRIKDAYAACACKVCTCLVGKTIAPRAEFCDCEPCKCNDCASLRNELWFDNINFRRRLKNRCYERFNCKNLEIKEIEACNCKPCDCIECSQDCNLWSSKPNYGVVEGNKFNESNNVIIFPAEKGSPQEIVCLEASIGKDMNCGSNLTGHECIDTQNVKKTDSKSCELEKCGSQLSSHLPPINLVLDQTNCGCDACSCLQCEEKSEWNSGLRPIFSHQFCKYAQTTRIKESSNDLAPEKYKRGKIYYINNENLSISSNKMAASTWSIK